MRRGQFIWGVILVLLGGLLLGNSLGIRFPNGQSPLDLFWPIILLFLGVWILLGVLLHPKVDTEKASVELQGAQEASVRISHGAGELKIHGGNVSPDLVRGMFDGGLDYNSSRKGDRLEVRMRPARDFLEFPFLGPHSRLDWDVVLNPGVPIDLKLELGANKAILDLTDLKITNLKLETGASETKLILPLHGTFRADLDLGAASLEIVIPDGLSARIQTSIGAGRLRIDESRFPRVDNYYQSPGFDNKVNSVEMTINAGAASIQIL